MCVVSDFVQMYSLKHFRLCHYFSESYRDPAEASSTVDTVALWELFSFSADHPWLSSSTTYLGYILSFLFERPRFKEIITPRIMSLTGVRIFTISCGNFFDTCLKSFSMRSGKLWHNGSPGILRDSPLISDFNTFFTSEVLQGLTFFSL